MPLHRWASKQAHFALLERAQEHGWKPTGHPTGICVDWDANKIYLYEDVGVGTVDPQILFEIPPLDLIDYLPRGPFVATESYKQGGEKP